MAKVVVTGAAGFIGSHVAERLLADGFDVVAVDNLSGGRRSNVPADVSLHVYDIRDTSRMQELFSGAEFVFHLAALPRVQYSIEHPQETSGVNVEGTISVLVAAKESGVKRVIFSASSSAYGDQQEMPLREDMRPQPRSPYGMQKYIGELLMHLWSDVYGLETVSLRYFNVYGPRQDPDGPYALVIGKFLKQLRDGVPLTITGDGEQSRDFTHVRDVVEANILAARSSAVGHGEVINVGSGRNVSISTLARLVGGPVEHIPARLEPKHTLADNSRAKSLLGWTPRVTLEDGIAELRRLAGL